MKAEVSRTPEIEQLILQRLSEGESLRAICRGEEMPTEGAVRKWVRVDPGGFGTQYTRARELGYECMSDELLDISDDGTNDWTSDARGNDIVDHDVIARSRLRVDTRKWLLSKMLPKVFGDKLELGGKVDGDGTITIVRRVLKSREDLKGANA